MLVLAVPAGHLNGEHYSRTTLVMVLKGRAQCFNSHYACWNAYGRCTCRNIIQHDCVGTNTRMLSDGNGPDYFGAGAYIDVTSNAGYAIVGTPNSHLLEN